MTFRVTPQHFTSNTVRYSQLRNRELLKLQEQVSTGLRIQKPSDAPAEIVSLMSSRARVATIDVDLANIGVAEGKLAQSVSHLETISGKLTEVQRIALEAPQSLDRETLAASVQSVLDVMLQVANSSDSGNALFGGTSGGLNPFSVVETDHAGRPAEVAYSGSADRSTIIIGAITVDVHYAGSEVFGVGASERGETIFLGQTGVRAGGGTDSATNRGSLIVNHTSTEYGLDSALAPGLSSDQDTILGIRQLTVDANAGTIFMIDSDGRESGKVFFEPGDRDVLVTGLDGEVIHVDTSGLTGFSGTIDVVGHGTLSVDGGASSVEIDFSSNQIVVNSTTGAVTNVDTTDVRKAGVEQIEYLGTSDLFQTLINLRDDLLNTRDLEGAAYQESLGRNQQELKRIHDHILESVGQQSASWENLRSLKVLVEDYQLEKQVQINDIASVDLAEAAIKLQQEQNALQFTYAASVGLMDLSILDFLR